jgi:hypothetical protein
LLQEISNYVSFYLVLKETLDWNAVRRALWTMIEKNHIEASGNNVDVCYGQVASKWRSSKMAGLLPLPKYLIFFHG